MRRGELTGGLCPIDYKNMPLAISLRSDANNAAKAVRAGDCGFETGQKTGTIHTGSALPGRFDLESWV